LQPIFSEYGKIEAINYSVFVYVCSFKGFSFATNQDAIGSLNGRLKGYRVVAGVSRDGDASLEAKK
jgi:hypothetical protein